MKKIVDMNGKDRAVAALLEQTAALTCGIVTKNRKPKPGFRSQRGMLVKGGLSHA